MEERPVYTDRDKLPGCVAEAFALLTGHAEPLTFEQAAALDEEALDAAIEEHGIAVDDTVAALILAAWFKRDRG